MSPMVTYFTEGNLMTKMKKIMMVMMVMMMSQTSSGVVLSLGMPGPVGRDLTDAIIWRYLSKRQDWQREDIEMFLYSLVIQGCDS